MVARDIKRMDSLEATFTNNTVALLEDYCVEISICDIINGRCCFDGSFQAMKKLCPPMADIISKYGTWSDLIKKEDDTALNKSYRIPIIKADDFERSHLCAILSRRGDKLFRIDCLHEGGSRTYSWASKKPFLPGDLIEVPNKGGKSMVEVVRCEADDYEQALHILL